MRELTRWEDVHHIGRLEIQADHITICCVQVKPRHQKEPHQHENSTIKLFFKLTDIRKLMASLYQSEELNQAVI